MLESVKGDALPLPLPGKSSNLADNDRLTRALEKDISPRGGGTMWDLSVGRAREDQVESWRVSTPEDVPEREELVLSLSHPPLSFFTTVVVTLSSQVSVMMKNRQSGIDELCSDKDKGFSTDKTLSKTGTRTRSRQNIRRKKVC